ncbi:MAG: SH3 domain-containing protein [Patescibacteria group bacterium]|nr:SH3 domain-containing protein [Patescibacteria group bacterium]
MSFRKNSKTVLTFLVALFVLSAGFLLLPKVTMASVKIVQFNKITNVQATLQAGGSLLPNTTYYVSVLAIETSGGYTLNTVNAMGELSTEISFTTTSVNKSANITWDTVTGNDIDTNNFCYFVLVSDTSGVYYGKKSNKSSYGNSADTTTLYLLDDYDGLNTISSSWNLPFLVKERYPSVETPFDFDPDKGYTRVAFSGVTSLSDIWDEAVTDGLTDFFYWDGLTFGMIGGWNWVDGDAAAGTSMTETDKTIILYGNSGMKCYDSDVTLTFGAKTTVDGVDVYHSGCRIIQKSTLTAYTFYYMASGNFNWWASYFYNEGYAAYKNCGSGSDFRNCLLRWKNGAYFTGANTYDLTVDTDGNIVTYSPDHFDSTYNCNHLYFYVNQAGEYYRCIFNTKNSNYDIYTRNYDAERYIMDTTFPRRSDNIPHFYWGGDLARISLLYTVKIKTEAGATIQIIDTDGNNATLFTKESDTTRGSECSNPVTADENGDAEFYVKAVKLKHDSGGDGYATITENYNPFILRIAEQGYPTKEFSFTLNEAIDWEISLNDKPQDIGSIKVWGTEYADDEAGTIYAQVTYGDGSPCNTIATADITATVYKSDGTKVIDGAEMTYVSSSNGIYKYDFSGGTFVDEGVYIIDTVASSTDPNITAYDSNEIHISASANKIADIKESLIGFTGTADSGTTTTLVDNVLTQADDFWNGMTLVITTGTNVGEIRQIEDFDAALDTITIKTAFTSAIDSTSQYLIRREMNWAERVWDWNTRTLTAFGDLAADIWNTTYSGVRKLNSRQIGESGVYIPGVTESGTVTQVANETDQETTKYNVELVRKATFDFAGLADAGGTTLTLVDSELTQPDDHWNNYELWMMSGNNMGEKRVIEDFVNSTHTVTVSSAFTSAIAEGDQYVISHERKLVHSIWNWSSRQLTSAANIAGDIWGYSGGRTLSSLGSIAADVWNNTFAPTRRLTDKTLTSGGSLVTESYIDTATSTIVAEIDANETLINNLNNISASDVWSHANRSIDDPDAIWEHALTEIGSTGSVGKLLKDNIDETISSRGISDLTAADVWSESTRTLTDYATSTIALAVWNNAQRTLTSYGNDVTAADVWNVLSSTLTTENSIGKQLADNVDATISSRASQTSVDTLQVDISYIRSKVDSIHTDTQYISGKVDDIVAKWGVYSASDIMGELDTVKSRIGTSTDVVADETLFGRTKFIQEKWGTQTAQTIYDIASSTLALVGDVQTELGYNGTSTTAYTEIQLIKDYTDDLEGYVGTPSDLVTDNTLFGKIKDVREKLDQLDTLETKLDTVDGIIDNIRASQQLNYTAELSDVGEVETTKTYRAKLSVWDYENNPVNASTAPTIIIYDASRATADTGNMTELSTGVYEYTYVVPSDATCGLWESVVSIDLGGTSALILNDYWEVEGSPAQVIINSMSDTVVPSISANVTISNEGNSGYEYQYEWCVVESQDNQCGGGDDIDYTSAAKYLNVGEDYIANLLATVPNKGDYWFKLVVYYGTEASEASKIFTANEGGGSGGITSVKLSEIYSKLLQVQNELGYHGTQRTAYKDLANTKYSLGALPNQLSEPLYSVLTGISSDIQTIGGTNVYNLNDIYEVLKANSTDLSYLANKSAELRAMAEVNKTLVSQAVNKPIIQTWWTEGSIILNIMAVNPPDAARTVKVKEYLPKEVREEHIIEIEEGLELGYDSALDTYFVSGEAELGAGERKIFKVRAEDVFKTSEEELSALKKQAETLMAPLQGTSYFAQASILKSEIDANLESISRMQIEGPSNIEKRIATYKSNQKDLQKVKDNIEALKVIVSEASGKSGVFGSLFGVSTTMTWAIIIIVVVGIAVLMILLYAILAKNRALEYHISGGKRLKAPPMVDVKKQAKKIKGGLVTYFLPPFGKPIVDLRQLIKMIKILVVVGILIVLILLRFYFIRAKNDDKKVENKTQGEITQPKNKLGAAVEVDFEEGTEVKKKETVAELNKLKITETGLGWLYVRSGYSTDDKILDKVDVGDEFDYTGEQDGWYKVILDDEDKTEGWVFGEYIEILANE